MKPHVGSAWVFAMTVDEVSAAYLRGRLGALWEATAELACKAKSTLET